MSKTAQTKFLYLVAGLTIGAAAALLFAPRSGKETRRLITKKAGEGKDYVIEKGREVRRQAEGLVEKGKDLGEKPKELVSEALEAGKQAYRSTFAR